MTRAEEKEQALENHFKQRELLKNLGPHVKLLNFMKKLLTMKDFYLDFKKHPLLIFVTLYLLAVDIVTNSI